MKLTEQEKEKIIENHNLVYGFMAKNNLDFDDWYDIVIFGLIEAAQRYDESKQSSFSYYAYLCMRSHMNREIKKHYSKFRIPEGNVVSYNKNVIDNEGEPVQYLDILYNERYRMDEEAITNVALEEIKDLLKLEEQKKAISLLYEGFTLKETGEIVGYSAERIRQIRKKVTSRYTSA